jgi:predicted phage terminase large subunit-like protein
MKRAATTNLSEYIKQAWPIVEPATPYLHNWHIDLICEYLELVTTGKITRLFINIPPRYMKSLIVSVFWPTWSWVIRPELRWLFASYSHSLALDAAGLRRLVLHSPFWVDNWGEETWIPRGSDTMTQVANNSQGLMYATSVGGTVTGKGGDFIVIDDPLNPKQALSDVQRETANKWFDRTISSRLNNKKTGAIVGIMQRLHEDDVTGHAIKKGNWTILKLPAVAEVDEEIKFPISGRVITRKVGDLLWPEREGQKEIDQARIDMGTFGFAGQMQQSPAPEGGGILQKKWWKYYNLPTPLAQLAPKEILRHLPKMNEIVISWDTSYKDLATSDYAAGEVWGRSQANMYLLDLVVDHMDFPTAKEAVRALFKKWPMARFNLVEDAANGPAIVQSLRNKVPRIISVRAKDSKIARAHFVTPLMEAGNVWLPSSDIAPWVEAFVLQCSQFPNGTHDDLVDSMSQALMRLDRPRLASA